MVFRTIRSGLVQLENRQQVVAHDHPRIAEAGVVDSWTAGLGVGVDMGG